jgi:hypothetical protein
MSRRRIRTEPAHCAYHARGVVCAASCEGRFLVAPAPRNTDELEVLSGGRTVGNQPLVIVGAPVVCAHHAPGMLCAADCGGRLVR